MARSGGGGGQDAGMRLLQDLQRRAPADLASWVVDQVGTLSEPGADLERTQLFQLAGAIGAATPEVKQELIRSALAGVEQMPAQQKAQAVRVGMQAAIAAQQAAAAAPSAGAGPSGGGDLSRPLLRGANGSLSSEPPAIVANLLRLGEVAKFDEVPEEKLKAIAQEADLTKIVNPQVLVEVVQELQPEEREAITQQLVEANVIPEEQKATFEAAIKPGGYADQFARLLRLVDKIQEKAHLIVGLLLAELLLSSFLEMFSCGVGLQGWLQGSAILWLGVCGCVYMVAHFLAPGWPVLRADPVGVVQRWSEVQLDGVPAQSEAEFEKRLKAAIPELPWTNVKSSGYALAGTVVLLLLTVLWALVGLWRLLCTLFYSCNSLVSLVFLAFMLLHVGVLAAVGLFGLYVVGEVKSQLK